MPEMMVSPAAMRVVKLLVGNKPKTVADLMDDAGVTRTAVTEQLNELVASGLVDRTTERLEGRGRPRHRYEANKAALTLLFANNQQLLVPAIWRAIADIGGKRLTRKVLNRVSKSMAEHYKKRITGKTPKKRLAEMIEVLREEGGLLEIEDGGNGHLAVHKRSCPFISMAEETGIVCCVDQEMMSLAVGAAVVRTACRHEGAPCCTFEISTSEKK
jgi:predicted ArsR family transcriptional regulator